MNTLALVLGLAFTTACGPSSSRRNSSDVNTPASAEATSETREGVLVRVAPARREPMSALYSTSATLRAFQQATITARTRGVVRRLAVEEGERVARDQPLAHLEDDEQKIAAERAQSTLETRRWEFERTERLFAQSLVSEEAFEAARREWRDAEQAAALADLELSRTIIRAPFRGVILSRHLDVGNTVSDGTAVYSLADVDRLRADVNVPERHIARLEPGQPVRLSVDATSDVVEAEIERIAPSVEVETGTVKVTILVAGKGSLRPGSFVRVDVIIDTHDQALVVPRSALVAEGRRWVVYRVAGDRANRLEVELGFEDGDRVEVLSTVEGPPIEAGERIVTAGVGALSDGAKIDVAEGTANGGADRDVGD